MIQDRTKGLNTEYNNWGIANPEIEAALKYKGNVVKFIKGIGKHGGSILPESLKWLWCDVK